MAKEGARRMCAQIDHNSIMQFLSYWMIAGKPCDLLIKPSAKSHNLLGVIFTVQPYDRQTIDFMEQVKKGTGAKMWDITK